MLAGHYQLLILAIVIILLFGGKKLPELARSLGKAKSEFAKGLKEGEESANAGEEKEEPGK